MALFYQKWNYRPHGAFKYYTYDQFYRNFDVGAEMSLEGESGHVSHVVVGIGINLAQPQEYFDAAGLPHGTSLALQGVSVDMTRP